MIHCCCAPCRRVTISANSCAAFGNPIAGVPITFTLGGSTVSVTTGVAGTVAVDFPSSGVWNWTTSPPSGSLAYTGLTGTLSVSCSPTPTTGSVNLICNYPRVLTYLGTVDQAQSSFYFTNTTSTPGPYTLTWQSRPAALPLSLRLLYFSYPGGVADPYYIDLPSEAWFSPPIPGFVFGSPTDIYFYAWVAGFCQMNVMVIDNPYTSGDPHHNARGAGNNIKSYSLWTCAPFQVKETLTGGASAIISGTHAGDDIINTAGNAGIFTNNRIGL